MNGRLARCIDPVMASRAPPQVRSLMGVHDPEECREVAGIRRCVTRITLSSRRYVQRIG